MRNTVVLFKGRPFRPGSPEDSQAYWPPLAIASIAAPLRDEGYEIMIRDDRYSFEENVSAIEEKLDDLVCLCVTALTGYEIKDALKTIEILKARRPDLPVVWGGWHASVRPHETLEHPLIDIVVYGLGQKLIVPLVNRLRDGHYYFADLPMTIASPEYRTGKVPDQKLDPIDSYDLSNVPVPAYDLLDLELIRRERLSSARKQDCRGLKITGAMPIVTSFGCPFECTYCCNPNIFGAKWGGYEVEKIIDLLKWLNERGFNWIEFIDAEFLIRWKRVKGIMEGIVENGIQMRWSSQATVKALLNMERRGMFPLLKEAGCYAFQIGVESGSANVLEYVKKKQDFEEVLEVARILKKYGIEGSFNCLVGLPKQEKFEDIFDTFRLAYEVKKIDPESMFPICFFTPLPGSDMYEDALECGFKAPTSLEEWGDYETAYLHQAQAIPWRSKKMEKLVLQVLTFYLPLAVPGNIERGTITKARHHMETHPLRFFIKLAHKLAKWRIKNQVYSFPVEFWIFRIMRKIMGKSAYTPGRSMLDPEKIVESNAV